MRLRLLAAFACFGLPAAAQSALHLIPMPREVSSKADQALNEGVTIECRGCDLDDQFAADELKQTLSERGLSISGRGLRISLHRAGQNDATFTDAMRLEGYTITSAPGVLTLTGTSASGVFYAAQTVKQMLERKLDGTWVLHAADIRDWPALRYRGLSDDLSRGPVDTLEFQKKLIRTLAAFKDNVYSPYFEHTQQYASNPLPAPPGGSISAADARALVAYAKRYHVLVIPEQEAFGHLHHNLTYDQYKQIAETPHGTVIAPSQPGSLQLIHQMFTELADLYPGPFLHVGADETVDLGLGQTKAATDAQGLGAVYLNFMQQIDTTLRPLNRKLLFWGDVAQSSPDLLKAMPEQFKKDTIAIAWVYSPRPQGFMSYLKPYKDAGFETWIASGINNWSKVYPGYENGLLNMQEFTRDGQAAGATGQLNTIWYDDGEALASNNWYGILFGAAAAWQQGESSIPAFENSYGQVFHGDATGKLNQAQKEVMAAISLLKANKLGEGADLVFWSDPWAADQQQNFANIRPIVGELRTHAERAMQLIAEARAAYPPSAQSGVAATGPESSKDYTLTSQLPSNPTGLRETDAIDALELGARKLDFIGLKFQIADEIPAAYARALAASTSTDKRTRASVVRELADINGVNGRIQDIKDSYSLIRGLYEQLWLRTNRPYALRPVLEHYDYTIGIWLARMDKARTAQRTWENSRVLPPASEVGIPAPQPGANIKPNVGQMNW